MGHFDAKIGYPLVVPYRVIILPQKIHFYNRCHFRRSGNMTKPSHGSVHKTLLEVCAEYGATSAGLAYVMVPDRVPISTNDEKC